MNARGHRDNDFIALDRLIEEITVDAYGDDEKLWAFRQDVRFLIDDIRTRTAWEEREYK